MVITKKKLKFGSATEELVLPPNTNDKNCIGTMNFISVLPSLPLRIHSPPTRRAEKGQLAHSKHSPFGGGGGMVWQYAKIHTLFL
jgi:hypothetical protein